MTREGKKREGKKGEKERERKRERERESVCVCVSVRGEVKLSQLLY